LVSGCLLATAAAIPPNRKEMPTMAIGSDRTWVVHEFGQPDSIRHEGGREIDEYASDPAGDTPRDKGPNLIGTTLEIAILEFAGMGSLELITAPFWAVAEVRCPR
jgi:hypothetical protein